MMTQLTDKYWAVEVPKDAYNFAIVDHKVRNLIDERDMKRIEWDSPEITHKFVIIPFGNYRFLFTTATATEEDARKVVETIHIEEGPSPSNDFAGGWDTGYVDYENRGEFAGYQGDAGCFRKAIESLASLLRSKGLNDKNNYAIIEKQGDE